MILTTNKKTMIYILLAFAFSIVVRLIWVNQFGGEEQFRFNNQLMINTNDGYYFAEGARDILAGVTKNTNDLSPLNVAASVLTAWIARILPFSFETIILYMPAFFASLVVVPIILIAREFDKLEVGFIAALVAGIAWSYYNRTMVGYYDTDMLNIVFPTVLLWSLIWAINTSEDKYLLIAALDSIAYRWWYPQSYALEFAFIGLIAIYVAYQYIKKQDFQTNLLLISFMFFAVVNLDGFVRFAIVIAFYILLQTKRKLVFKYLYYIFAFAVALFFLTGGFDPIWSQLKSHVFRDVVQSDTKGLGLHFFSVKQTVREAGKIPFETFANRISGHTITFIASLLGYIWFSIRYPIMLLALPMLGLGFLAYGIPGLVSGGLRFTIYAVPVMALGLGFIVYEVSKWLGSQFINKTTSMIVSYILMVGFTVGALYPNIQHVIAYKVPTVFNKSEVNTLDKLKSIANQEDYVIAWWDYGYPIRYYSDVKTLIDGGKHSGAVNFPVSFALNNAQIPASKMARLDVEYTEKRFHLENTTKWTGSNIVQMMVEYTEKRFHLDNTTKWEVSNIEQMMLDYGHKNPDEFLASLNSDIEMPSKTRDIYFYLPSRMMNLITTIDRFSNLEIQTGKPKDPMFFYVANRYKEDEKQVDLGNGVVINKQGATINIGNENIPLREFAITEYDKNGILHKNIQKVNSEAKLSVIFMKNYNKFLVLDNRIYDSTYIQLFVLENYDKELFEPVILTPQAKIYKLKI